MSYRLTRRMTEIMWRKKKASLSIVVNAVSTRRTERRARSVSRQSRDNEITMVRNKLTEGPKSYVLNAMCWG